ncbi:MAG: hypothetical protein Crog4KO_07160 [Crocinitomicaceae bacterium]
MLMTDHIHIFRTEIKTDKCLEQLSLALNEQSRISRWHIDTKDIDNVLKVESETLSEDTIIALVREKNIHCEALPD